MWRLTEPAFDPGDVYELCISGVSNASSRAKLLNGRHGIVVSDAAYRSAAVVGRAAYLDSNNFRIPGISDSELVRLYDRQMSRKGSVGRRLYDQLRIGIKNGVCPLCGHRTVSTLDHYLPKTKFPSLAVNPHNLVPCCRECNNIKLAQVVPVIHPYYDDVEDDVWLSASIVQSAPAAVIFEVAPPTAWNSVLAQRVSDHFRLFELDMLYAAQAARMMAGKRHHLLRLDATGGTPSVQAHLEHEADSWQAVDRNGWEAALFRCLAGDAWFCSGGFRAA